ncbi:hypothetical protein QNA08_02900 [Chelatococcus sp. SYSU_G07232]|uniref:Uncharacterized protein n=1 Tax=Chelatococcus albus TaxID=3047466 RepID=A0ABT7ACT5_9HYPH|nr:hypothetical protein [Chelatococcus sp. SYSU_G07232]MDJ1157187.1 hypothetical protein [Chelatococcus sp. SYSU_G07232]
MIELPRRTIALAPTPEHAAEVARYVEQLTTELAAMARSTRLDVLAYILEMARHEAHGHAIQHKTDA